MPVWMGSGGVAVEHEEARAARVLPAQGGGVSAGSDSLFPHGSQADRIARQVMSTDEALWVARLYDAAENLVRCTNAMEDPLGVAEAKLPALSALNALSALRIRA